MNFKHLGELRVNVDDWYVFLLPWPGNPYGRVVQEMMEWFEDNIESSASQTYALWYMPKTNGLGNVYYVSIKNDEDVMAYKLRWT